MTSRTPISHTLRVLVGLMAALALTLVAPTPAHAATVSLSASASSAPPSTQVIFSGTTTGVADNAPVVLKRRKGTAAWGTIRTGTVSSGTFSFSVRVAVGTYDYRAFAGGAASPQTVTVIGLYERNVQVPAPGAPFTMKAQLPMAQARDVQFQLLVNGAWVTRGHAMSLTSGLVGVRSLLTSTTSVRFYAPAAGSAPAWAGPSSTLTIGSDYVITRILQDTNNYRQANGRPALKLYWALNRTAGNWAYYMHQTSSSSDCPASFKHNPNFSAQYPSGWTRAGENIAADQSYTTVVSE